MKSLYRFFTCILLIVCNVGFSQQADVATAIKMAQAFGEKTIRIRDTTIASKNNQSISGNAITYIIGQKDTCLYGISFEGGGWALISADKRIRPVLAYSDTGFFPEWDNINPSALGLIQSYIKEVEYAKDSLTSDNIHPEWFSALSRSEIYIIVDNLLKRNGEEVLWNQRGNQDMIDWPYNPTDCNRVYNKFCPTFTSQPYSPCSDHGYVGCTAVAMGQIMWYWQWPYYARVPLAMTDSFGNTAGTTMHQYDWEKMPCYLTNSSDMDNVDMVAGLLRDCGYATNMKYGVNGSGTNLSKAASALRSTFHYLPSATYLPRPEQASQQDAWLDLLKAELNHARPVLYGGHQAESLGGIGHSFVLAGYNSADYFYVNWSTYHPAVGIDNGFVSLNNMITSSGSYNYKQDAVVGITPQLMCSSQIPTTQPEWETNLVELYHGDAIIQNKIYDNSTRGIIYSDRSIRITGDVRIAKGANIHIAIKNMYCDYGKDDSSMPSQRFAKKSKISAMSRLIVSPNPVLSVLHIHMSDDLSQAKIYALNGQCVLQASQTDIDVSGLPEGMYILQAETLSGAYMQTKFIKD